MRDHWNRRQVLRRLGATGIAGVGLGRVSTTARGASPNDKLNLAIVGCGGQGAENLEKVAGENIVALCDVDEQRAADAFQRHPKAKRFRDYRKMLDGLHQQIDAVVVSIPDHMHAPVSLAAMELGKHVYCEKPLTWSIDEARRMASLAREKKLATQMGTQGMAADGARTGIEIIRSGVLGDVTELHVWTDRPAGWWPQGIDRPRDTPPVPSNLDWNLWLGVASARPYHPAYCPFAWRGWKDFGTGAVGDMGIHNAAMPFAALELGPPASAEILQTSGLKPETFPAWSRLKLEFAGQRWPRTDHAVLVRWGTKTVGRAGRRPQACRQRRDRRGHERNALVRGVDRRRLGPAARGSVSRLQTAPAFPAPRSWPEPSPGVAGRLPRRRAGLLPLRWLRFPTDRDHARGQPRTANRPEDPLECRSHGGPRLPRGVRLHQT